MLPPPQLRRRIHRAARWIADFGTITFDELPPHDQIHVELHGSLVLLSDGGGSLGGSLSEWLTLGRSDSLVDGSCESLVDGDELLSDPLAEPLSEWLCE